MPNDAIPYPVRGDALDRPSHRLEAWRALRRPLAAMLDQALVSGASFVAVVLIGRLAGERQLGLYSLAATLIVLGLGVQESLLLIPFTVFAPKLDDDRRQSYAANTLAQSGVAGVAMLACLGLAAVAVSASSTLAPLTPVLLALFVAMPAVLVRDVARRFAFATLRLDRALVIDAAVAALQLSLLGWLAASSRLSAFSGVAAIGVSCGIVALVWLCRSGTFRAFARAELRPDWRKNWSLGSWLLAGHVVGISQAYALHWLLAVMVDTRETGAFAALTTFVALANPLVAGLGNFLMPATSHAFASSGSQGVWRLTLRAAAWLALPLAAFCLFIALTGDESIGLLYGGDFAGHATALTLLALATTASAAGLAPEQGLRSLNRPRPVVLANLLALAATISVAAGIVPVAPLRGAALGLLAGHLVGCVVRWCALARLVASPVLPVAEAL